MSGPDCDECGEYFLDCNCNMSRPKIPIDWKRVDELLEAGCLGTEIAAFFGIHPDTFYGRVESKYDMGFSHYSAQKKSTGEALIREAQFKKAVKKLDNTMLIWLGKQRLGQRENITENDISQETTAQYLKVIQQLASLQSDRKIPDNILSSEEKSA